MEYSFYKKEVDTTKRVYFLVTTENQHSVLQNLSFQAKDTVLAQEIIDGIQKTKDTGARYEWANEDVYIMSDDDGVFFWDKLARRADKKHPTKQDLQLTHQEFIDFMKDFKQFIEDNK